MKEAFEKIIERLEEPTNYTIMCGKHFTTVDRAIEIVNQVAEEYSSSEIPNKLLDSLHEKILKSKFAEEVTEAEIDALVKAKWNMSEKPTSSGGDKNVLREFSHRNHELDIEASHSNDGWIPVSERLPQRQDSDCTFICFYLVQGHFERIYKGFRNEDGEWVSEHGNIINGVIAWMPLPEPYKPKGE